MNFPAPPRAIAAIEREGILHPRAVEHLITGQPTRDGAGVTLNRLITPALQRRLDPFLMLDAFGSDSPDDYLAGFPDHPHRGFETITFMIEGRMRHRDSVGHEGVLTSGGVQWMVAGRGVIHSELPEQQDGRMEGFQLWLNLAARDKLCPPWYRDIAAADLPVYTTPDGVRVQIIAGRSHGIHGAVERPVTEPLYLDIRMTAGSHFAQPLPAGHNVFVCVYLGQVCCGAADTEVAAGRMAILETNPDADGVLLTAKAPTRLILVAGRPLGEPIVQYGPFVMNTEQEIRQTLEDFRAGRF